MHGTFSSPPATRDPENASDYQSDDNNDTVLSEPKSTSRVGFSWLVIPMFVLLFGAALLDSRGSLHSEGKSHIATYMELRAKATGPQPSFVNKIVPEKAMLKIANSADIKKIQARNEYGVFTAPYPYLQEVQGSQIVEPYKQTTITVEGAFVTSDVYVNFLWQIEGQDQLLTGPKINVMMMSTGTYEISVHAFNKADQYLGSYTTALFVKYVKREIRSLTVEDREKFLDAMAAIWKVDQGTGKKTYGEGFNSIHTFVREHAIASGDIMCDQFHEGSGFLTHHLALANSFELAMRAVDPSVTLHYWDFTQEGQTIKDLGLNPSAMIKITPVLSDTWFGSISKDNLIENSRWAHLAMPQVEKSDDPSTPHNSYGYIRSYWNNNNNPEITRHMFDTCGTEPTYKMVPSCQDHYDVLNVHSLSDFQMDSPGDAHGPMHVQFGGMFGGCSDKMASFTAKYADYLNENLTSHQIKVTGQNPVTFMNKWGYTAQRQAMFNKVIVGEYFHIYRSLWRSHMCAVNDQPALLQCPESCDIDTPFDSCTCEVKGLVDGSMDWTNLTPCLLNSESNREFFNKTFTVEFMKDLTTVISTASVKEGEMLEAASPADVVFWMIHTVIERLLSAKRLAGVNSLGGTEFYKWKGVMGKEKSSWNTASYYNLKAGQNKWYQKEYTCAGQAADDAVLPDALPFTDVIKANADLDGDGTVSNWEYFMALDPTDPNLNDYVFDNFKWDHCEGKVENEDDDEVATTYATNVMANRMHESMVKSAMEDSGSSKTETYGAVQDHFSLTQAGIIVSVIACVVMLFTWIQFTINLRNKSEGAAVRR